MIDVKLTKEELQNLLVFLSRTQLNGNEAQAFNMLALKFREALQSEEPKATPMSEVSNNKK